jgi:RNA polymerase sigma-70 factor (ECF subfamily)
VTAGDERSAAVRLEKIHELVAGDLLDYFARRVDSVEDAAELLADTLLVAWRRLDRLPPDDEGCRMWMFVTARGVLSNWRRGLRRRSALATSLREQLMVTSQRMDDDEEPRASDVRSAIRSLPHAQRELVILVHWDGFSIVDAASVLGIRESTARGRYQRAMIRLRNELGPAHPAPANAQIGKS